MRQSYERLTALGFSGTVRNALPLVKITDYQTPIGIYSHSMSSTSINTGVVRAAFASAAISLLGLSAGAQQQSTQPVQEKQNNDKRGELESKQPEAHKLIEMNLLGKTDAASGHSRPHHNLQPNPTNNN